jgi:pimeloyl-ACP methyl ester carboxylesterase
MRTAFLALAGLVVSATVAAQVPRVDEIRFDGGSGSFRFAGGTGREEKTLTIFYHRPAAFTRRSQVLIVVPGAGRNAGDYRDAWVDASEEHGVLILSPSYSEEHYPEFWSYNLAGMITDVRINQGAAPTITFNLVSDPADWIFDDFDRIFREVKERLALEASTYDLFGHSAGGQVIHRLALFHTDSMADRMLAANSGWYTVPTFDDQFPYGLANGASTREQVTEAFAENLVVFLGELDDENETRGDLVRTPEVDVQGISRIERGNYFYNKAVETAEELGAEFNWKLEVVPNVGHDSRRMSEAAAEYLYSVSP